MLVPAKLTEALESVGGWVGIWNEKDGERDKDVGKKHLSR